MKRIAIFLGFILLAASTAHAQVYPAPPNVGTAAARPATCVASNPYEPMEPAWYFATDTSALSICKALNTWGTASGGIPSQQVAPNPSAIIVSQHCGTQTNCYQVVADVKVSRQSSIHNGLSALTCPDCGFVNAAAPAGDVNKIYVFREEPVACCSTTQWKRIVAQGTITAVGSSTTATLSGTATADCLPSGGSPLCNFAYGTADDTAQIQAATQAAYGTAGLTCPSLKMDFAGYYFFSANPFAYTPPTISSCTGTYGPDAYQTGPSLSGEGMQGTVGIPLDGIAYTSACNPGCVSFPQGSYPHEMGFDGLGDPVSGVTIQQSLVAAIGVTGPCAGEADMREVMVAGWAPLATGPAIYVSNTCGGSYIEHNIVQSSGSIGIEINVDGHVVNFKNNVAWGETGANVQVVGGGGGILNDEGTYGAETSGGGADGIYFANTNALTYNCKGSEYGLDSSGIGGGYAVIEQGNAMVANWDGCHISVPSNTTGTTHAFFSQNIYTSGLIVNNFSNTAVTATGLHNQLWNTQATYTLVNDKGGNTFQDGSVGDSLSGMWFGSASVTGVAIATSNFALTTCGTVTPSTVTAAAGGTQSGNFTITYGGTPGTACTVTYTFPTTTLSPFFVAPQCTFTVLGGTNPVIPTLTNGTISTTSAVVVLGASALTNTDTDIIGYNCSVPL